MEDPDVQVNCWMKDVRELSYDIEDAVDEFMLEERDRRKLPGFKGFIDRSINLLTKTKTRHRIAAEIQGLKTRVVEASQRRERYKVDAAAVSKTSSDVLGIDPRVRAIYGDGADLVGIDGPRDKLIKMLMEDGVETQQLKVVSIFGCGGLGKTTLAHAVYKKLKGQFQCSAFVSVSQKPDLKKILGDILSQVGLPCFDIEKTCEVQQLVSKLIEFLEDKRYFIIIDDIWSILTWRDIKCALLENNRGSRIMTTTRIIDVAKSCCAPRGEYVCEVNALCSDDSRKLFFLRIFGFDDGCPTQLKEISDEILKRCGGLPLAIITIASLLANNSTSKIHWENVRSSIDFSLQKYASVEEMKRILSLSYNELPYYLKTCLLYLSIFPEDYEIKKERLVRRWIAEGFIKIESGKNLEEVGEEYFNELINRSMIQPVGIQYDGRVEACRVHDMILELIVSKSVDENFVTLFGNGKNISVQQDKIRRLSLDYRDGDQLMVPSTVILSHVRSLTLFGNIEQMPPVSHFRLLRVLDLEDSTELKNHHLKNIKTLSQLKYLKLPRGISELPEQIGELEYLETLDLRSTIVRKLPRSIVRLRHLVYLLVPRYVVLPDGIGNMQALEVLSVIGISSSCSISSLQELGNLTKLKILVINVVSHDGDNDREARANVLISSLSNLGKFKLRSLSVNSFETTGCPLEFLLGWSPPPYFLQHLYLDSMFGSFPRIPEWIAPLHNLRCLDIHIESSRQEDIQLLGDLPALLSLTLTSDKALEERLIVGNRIFQCLKVLSLPWWCGMGLMFEEGAMPELERIELIFDVHETKSLYGDFDFGIQHLSHLRDVDVEFCCRRAKVSEVEAAEAAFRNAANILPNHPPVRISRHFIYDMINDKEGVVLEDDKKGHEEHGDGDGDTKQEEAIRTTN